MKKTIMSVCAVVFLAAFVLSPAVYAQDEQADTVPVAVQAPEEAQPAVQLTPAEEKQLALEASVRAILMSQEWVIYLRNQDGSKGVEIDTLVFTETTVNSKNLSAMDYPVSNYGLFVSPDGAASWETMKTNAANRKAKAFVRGDLKGNMMTGAIFMKSDKAKPTTLIFSTVNPSTIVAPPAEESAPVSKAAAPVSKRIKSK